MAGLADGPLPPDGLFLQKDDKAALAILGVNPGLDIPKNKFLYAGYKGGSEAGVLNLTWLLKTSGPVNRGTGMPHGSWNNERMTWKKINFELMQAAINAIGK